jgi:glycerol-3-phosphate dehydrogenase
VSAAECVRVFPALDAGSIDGGALWYDARMTRPERLTLAFVASAAAAGAQVANHVEAEGFQIDGGKIRTVQVVDRLDGRRYPLRARQVIIAAGPWTNSLAARASGDQPASEPRQALALNLVVGRRLAEAAVGLKAGRFAGPDPGGSGGRFLFLAPQDRTTLLGTWYALDGPGDAEASLERGAGELLAAFNRACPGLDLSASDIVGRQWGRLPLKAGQEPGDANTLADRPRIGSGPRRLENLLTVEAVKYTTARAVAEDVVDQVLASMGLAPRPCRTAETPLVGAGQSQDGELPLADRMQRAAREEMAVTLGDVVFRRTELGNPPGPTPDQVQLATAIVGDTLGWDAARRARESATLLERETP